MMPLRATVLAAFAGAALLGGCGGGGEPELMNIRSGSRTPDEFTVLPSKPIEVPEDLPTEVAALPVPTPGGPNRTDPTPEADAVAALGGIAAQVARDGRRRGGAALLRHATRFGVAGNIRALTAREDLAYRRRNDGRLLERLFNLNIYYDAYEPMSLDQHAELERFRRLGARTPAAPPRADGE